MRFEEVASGVWLLARQRCLILMMKMISPLMLAWLCGKWGSDDTGCNILHV